MPSLSPVAHQDIVDRLHQEPLHRRVQVDRQPLEVCPCGLVHPDQDALRYRRRFLIGHIVKRIRSRIRHGGTFRHRQGSLKSKAPRYTCLEGPLGTGETTLTEAISVSADWAFISTSVGSWFANSGGHLGDVIRAARKFFDDIAFSPKPVVALLDEIDAMDKDALSWWVPVVTYLLTEIGRLRKGGKPVLLIGATNHYDRLDGALVRPGRLEKRTSVLLPDPADRHRLFASCLGGRIGDEGPDTLARLAVTATPAKIESWCQSAIAAAESEQRSPELRGLVDLIAPADGRTPEQDRAVAIHEAGHAMVAIELGLRLAPGCRSPAR